MEIWLDTSNVEVVAFARDLGILQGVTTNPTILSRAKMPSGELISQLLEVQAGVVAVQVFSDGFEAICDEAKALSDISDRILVKIPVTQNGIRAIHTLRQEGMQVLATAIFTPYQALLAFKAGANYLAPYLGRIADTGENPIQVISQMHLMKQTYGFDGKIMAAGIRDLPTVMGCIEEGICAVTLPEGVFKVLVQDYEPTLKALQKFAHDWLDSGLSGL